MTQKRQDSMDNSSRQSGRAPNSSAHRGEDMKLSETSSVLRLLASSRKCVHELRWLKLNSGEWQIAGVSF